MIEPNGDCIFEFCETVGFRPTSRQKRVLGSVLAGVKTVDCGSDQDLAVVLMSWRLVRRTNSTGYVIAPEHRGRMKSIKMVKALLAATPWGALGGTPTMAGGDTGYLMSCTRHSVVKTLGSIEANHLTIVNWGCADLTSEESAAMELSYLTTKDRLRIDVRG